MCARSRKSPVSQSMNDHCSCQVQPAAAAGPQDSPMRWHASVIWYWDLRGGATFCMDFVGVLSSDQFLTKHDQAIHAMEKRGHTYIKNGNLQTLAAERGGPVVHPDMSWFRHPGRFAGGWPTYCGEVYIPGRFCLTIKWRLASHFSSPLSLIFWSSRIALLSVWK